MNLDFTHKKYAELCNAISNSSYLSMSVGKYLFNGTKNNVIILRHDVDCKIKNSLKIAKIEREKELTSTYYIRMAGKVFKPDTIREIEGLGHEIGYHYEVLDKAKGNHKKAIEIFKDELTELRKVCDVRTICMHGNPLTRWDNRDLWKRYNFKDFGIDGEAYLSIDYSDVVYFSDTGRTWSGEKYRVKDVVDGCSVLFYINSTDGLIELIKDETIEQMCILAHPGQWSDGYGSWVCTWAERSVRNFVKANMIRRMCG